MSACDAITLHRRPDDFDLRGASIGNLILTGGFLEYRRDINAALYLFKQLVNVHGVVRPTSDANLHLKATHRDGVRTSHSDGS